MAYKNSSDRKQASLRRIIPKNLGDFSVGDLTPEQRRDNLIAVLNNTTDGHEKARICSELSEVKKEIKRFKWQNRDLADLLISVIRADSTVAQWNIWGTKAREYAEIRSKLPQEEMDKLIAAGTCDDYHEVMKVWKNLKNKSVLEIKDV